MSECKSKVKNMEGLKKEWDKKLNEMEKITEKLMKVLKKELKRGTLEIEKENEIEKITKKLQV